MLDYKDFESQFDKLNINKEDGIILLNYFEVLASLILNTLNFKITYNKEIQYDNDKEKKEDEDENKGLV